MFRYIIVILFINTSYRSLGNPIDQTVSLVNPLTALADRCENAFLSKQIQSQIPYCSNISINAPHSEKELQCLIFYDINSQLCSAVGAKKLALPDADYTTKINKEQDVDSLCSLAKDWPFSDLPEFSNYKKAVGKVFKQSPICGKICGVEDVLSNDVNFFCKYFKWGTDMLKLQVVTSSTQGIAINNAQPPPAAGIDGKPVASAQGSNESQDVQVINGSTESKLNVPTSNVSDLPGTAKVDVPKPETSSAVNKNSQPSALGDSNVAAPPVHVGNEDTFIENIEDTGAMPDNDLSSDNTASKVPDNVASNVESVLQEGNKPDINEVTQNKPDGALKPNEDKDLNAAVENPPGRLPADGEDYPDSEDGKVDGDNEGGDDGEDADLTDPKIDQKPAKKTENIGFTFNREQDIYSPNASQDFPEEDDHFFPFFLTAVIMVVLLYVLYHNKNKVGKVFFGLMLEGRQANRRRNSRGHAYRRLDTLEQAMSANTAAPPSKIIY